MNTEFLSLVTLGKNLVEQANNGHEMDKPFAVSCLLHLESILDLGRTFIDGESREEVIKGMDEIRSSIKSILEKMSTEEAKKFLEDNARSYTNRVTSLIK